MTRKIALTAVAVLSFAGLTLGAGAQETHLDPANAFVDDEGNIHEPNIDRAAALDITEGCDTAGPRYSPSDFVRRDQMATFLVNTYNAAAADDAAQQATIDAQQAEIDALEARIAALEP